MRRFLNRTFPLLLLALLAIGIPVGRALAVETVTWYLGSDTHGGVISPPAGTATQGFGSFESCGLQSSQIPNGNNDFFSDATWTDIGRIDYIYFHFTPGSEILFWRLTLNSVDQGVQTGGGEAEDDGMYIYWDLGEFVDVTTLNVYFDSSDTTFCLDYIQFHFEDDEPGGPGEGLTFPLAGEDAHEQWGTYDLQYVQDNDPEIEEGVEISEFPNTVYAFSNDPEAEVSAVADGRVISVTPYTGRDCSGAVVILQNLRRCRVIIPAFITQEVSSYVFNIELINISLVVVEDAEDDTVTYTYWLADAVVDIGDIVTAGCILGKTIQLKNPTNFEISGFDASFSGDIASSGDASISISGSISFEFRTLLINAGVTTVVAKVDGEPVQLYPLLTEEPTQDDCRTSALTNCILDNPDLKAERNGTDIELWDYSGGVTAIDGGGAHLPYNSFISQSNIAILPDIGYTLSVMARVTTPIDSFYPLTLRVGDTTTTMNVTEGEYQPLVWELGPRETSTLSVVGVFNQLNYTFNSEFPVEVDIKYICFTPETAAIQPGSCVFTNHQFDGDGQGWLADGSVQFINGQAILGDDGTIDQPLLLLPDGDTPVTYTVTAYVRLLATNAYTGQSGKEIELLYRFPESGMYVELGTIDDVLVQAEGLNIYDGTVNIEHVYILSDSFEISEGTDGLFSFNVQITDAENYLRSLKIDRLCIQADTEDGSIPGQPGGGGFTPPFIEKCGVIPTPTDNNISSWTYYHWKNLEKFFSCTLMVKLNQMAATIDTAWKTTRLFMRWCVVLVNRTGDWFTTFVWWLGGHFNNIALGAGNTVISLGEQVDTSANIFGDIVEGVKAVAAATKTMVDALQNLLNQFVGFYNFAAALVNALVTAYSAAEAIPIPNLPTCTIATDEHIMCVAFWVIDNTILSGPGAALIPIILSFGTTHLLLWLIIEFKRNVLSQGQSL